MRRLAEKRLREKPRVLPRTREQPPAELTIEIDLQSQRIADTLYTSLLPETRQPAGYRSQTAIGRRGRTVVLNIKAEDIVALRAASNSFLRFVSVALKTLNVVAPFYRAETREAIRRHRDYFD